MQSYDKFLTIIDIGLQTKAEHSYSMMRGLRAELLARGIGIEIYGNSKVDCAIVNELSVIPYFKFGMYEHARSRTKARLYLLMRTLRMTTARAPISESIGAQRYNDQFFQDLVALPLSVFACDKTSLFPGIFQNQILGLARFVSKKHLSIQGTIVCTLMFPPDWTPWGKTARIGPGIYAKAFKLLKPFIGSKVFFVAENLANAELFHKQFDIEVAVLAIPLRQIAKTTIEKKNQIRIGFMGNSKSEKGFQLLPEAICICAERRRDLEFVIQVNPAQNDSWASETIDKLRLAPKTRLIEGPLPCEVFTAESAALDIVLLPYDPQQFGMRGSGIFTEAVTGGKLIVATKGIWAAQAILNKTASGEVFEKHSSLDLADAILRLCDRYCEANQLAVELAQKSGNENSPAVYLDQLFALAQ